MSQRAWFCHPDRWAQRKCAVDGLLDVRSNVFGIVAGYNFNLHFEMLHLMHGCHRHLELVHTAKLPDHVFDSCRIDVYTPDGHHIVAAAQQSAVKSRECASTSAGSEIHPYEVSSAITNNWKPRTTQIRSHQLAGFT